MGSPTNWIPCFYSVVTFVPSQRRTNPLSKAPKINLSTVWGGARVEQLLERMPGSGEPVAGAGDQKGEMDKPVLSPGSSRHVWQADLGEGRHQQHVDQTNAEPNNGYDRQEMNGTQSSDDDLPEDLLVEAADWEVSIQVHSVKAEEKEVRSNGQAGHLRKLEPVETIANDLKLSASGSLRPEVPEVERVGASQIPQLSLSRRKQGPMDSAESRRTDSAKSTSKAESDNSEPRRADGARARRSSFKVSMHACFRLQQYQYPRTESEWECRRRR